MSRRQGYLLLAVLAAGGIALGGWALAAEKKGEGNKSGHSQHAAHFERCAKACAACARECESCATHCGHQLAKGKKAHLRTLMTCRDCAEFCTAAARICSRLGPMAGTICEACARACDTCGAACIKFEDEHMKRCAKACQTCAKACRDMVKHTKMAEEG
jgi:hypothetical protein